MKKQLTKRVYASVYDKCVRFIDKENQKVKDRLKKGRVKNAFDAIKNLNEDDKKLVLAKLSKGTSTQSEKTPEEEEQRSSSSVKMTYL